MEAKHVFVFEHHRHDPFFFIIASYMSSFSWFYIRNQQKSKQPNFGSTPQLVPG